MRELRFRVWDNEKKELVYFANDDWDIYGHSGDIMQYTGLKDKNGKEVWEGDILKVTISPTISSGCLYTVYWNDMGAWYVSDILNAVPLPENRLITGQDLYYGEVVDNVYSFKEGSNG